LIRPTGTPARFDRDDALTGLKNRVRAKTNLVSRIKPIRVVQPSREKYHFRFSEMYGSSLVSCLSRRGVSRSS
jgi:hypothetical protein